MVFCDFGVGFGCFPERLMDELVETVVVMEKVETVVRLFFGWEFDEDVCLNHDGCG